MAVAAFDWLFEDELRFDLSLGFRGKATQVPALHVRLDGDYQSPIFAVNLRWSFHTLDSCKFSQGHVGA